MFIEVVITCCHGPYKEGKNCDHVYTGRKYKFPDAVLVKEMYRMCHISSTFPMPGNPQISCTFSDAA